jgi:ribosomal protein S18 acetylase RimI-like enzyme
VPDITFRQATVSDAPEIAVVHRRSSFLPVMDTPEEDLAHFRDWEFSRSFIWVAEVDQRIVGFLAREGEWVHQLHILPEFQGVGIGSQLLAKAKSESPRGLKLYTYQENSRARAFYEARGFTNVEFNDAGREEGRPDVLMEWRQ